MEQRIDLSGRWGDGGRAGRPAPTFIFGCYASMPPPNIARIVSGSVAHAGGGRIKLWFVTNGPKGALEGPGAHSARVLGRRLLFLAVVPRYPPPIIARIMSESVAHAGGTR